MSHKAFPISREQFSANDAASEDDRIWFEHHPAARVRNRLAFPGEQNAALPFVIVKQIRPGLRLRIPAKAMDGETVQ